MTSHKQNKLVENRFDAMMTHRIKNWSEQAALPLNGKQQLLSAALEYDRLEEARQAKFFRQFLPIWLQSYLLVENRFLGCGDYSQSIYANRTGETSFSLLVYLYSVRCTLT